MSKLEGTYYNTWTIGLKQVAYNITRKEKFHTSTHVGTLNAKWPLSIKTYIFIVGTGCFIKMLYGPLLPIIITQHHFARASKLNALSARVRLYSMALYKDMQLGRGEERHTPSHLPEPPRS